MAGKRSDSLIKNVVKTIKHTAPSLFKPCPFGGRVELYNISLKNDLLLAIYPSGRYNIEIRIFDDIDSQIFNVRTEIELKS